MYTYIYIYKCECSFILWEENKLKRFLSIYFSQVHIMAMHNISYDNSTAL
jgi:hypothetical protein